MRGANATIPRSTTRGFLASTKKRSWSWNATLAVLFLLIFVNRKGVELRRLEEDDYFALIEEGQVDILEAQNNFREQVERARARLQRHQS